MDPGKEHYRRKLPHFQQPGQWYSVSCILAGAMPKGAMQKYSIEVEMARNRQASQKPHLLIYSIHLAFRELSKAKSRIPITKI